MSSYLVLYSVTITFVSSPSNAQQEPFCRYDLKQWYYGNQAILVLS